MFVKGIGALLLVGALLAAGAFLGYDRGYDAGVAEEASVVVRDGWSGAGIFFKIFLVFFLFMFISKFFMFARWRRHGLLRGIQMHTRRRGVGAQTGKSDLR